MQPVPKDKREKFISELQAVNEKYSVLVRIGFETGLRISEILKLQVKTFGRKMRVYQSKTKKHKNISISNDLYWSVREYIARSRLEDTDALIPSTPYKKQKPLSRTQAFLVIRRVASKLGVLSIGTHSMRKTYAKDEYARTGSLECVKTALGHESLETTLRYLVNFNELEKLITE